MPTFSPKNFPASVNNLRWSGAGERTDYVSDQPGEGFRVDTDTILYPCLLSVEQGMPVWFTSTELRDAVEADARTNGVFAPVSLTGPGGETAGNIRISHVTKPSGNSQSRVAMGEAAQKSVCDFAESRAFTSNLNIEFKSSAPPGSNSPDLVYTMEDGTIQFEIKGAPSFNSTVTLFDKSVRRGSPTFLDRFVEPLGFVTLDDCVDHHRNEDTTIGYAGDPGVVKSGKLPAVLDVCDPELLVDFHGVIKNHFAESGDNYFAVYNRTTDGTAAYHTGHGDNALCLPDLPMLTQFKLATYGGPSNGATRIGVKVKFE